jgi:hypothetical protein
MNDDANPDTEQTAATEHELCPQCLEQNRPGTNFCRNCGAPLSAYAATGPFERLFAEGNAYRQATEQPHRPIVVVGIWLIFGIGALTGIGMAIGNPGVSSVVTGTAMAAFSGFIIAKTTRNYLRRQAERASNSA